MADVAPDSTVPNDSSSTKEESRIEPEPQEETKQEEPSVEESEGKEQSNSNVYRYIKEDLFTSEIFKVEIQNLPKFTGFNDLKKFLNKHGLNPHKIKLIGRQTFAFVTFKNQDDRDKAMKLVHGMQWKGKVLSVRLAKPKADPIAKKRRQDGEAADHVQPASKRPTDERDAGEEEPLSTQIANAVTPLWQVQYEEQLKRKECEVEAVLQKLAREIGNNNKAMLPWLFVQKEKNKGMCCPLKPIRPSPLQTEYRNKCEFVIGTGADGEDKTKLSVEEIEALKSSMKQFFTDGEGKDSGVTSLHFVRIGQRTCAGTEDLPCELVAGDAWIHEELLGLRFRISPHSFFQTNTPAAEVLYSSVGEWAQLDQESTVLDVCCGTGTIGISLAKRVKKVIGIELCQEAVEDAKVNAKANGLTNIEFHCGKAEDIFPTVLNAVVSPNVTAIVDPPRAGLHSKVILAIRRAEHLKRLVYVACNAKAAMNNFVDLCRAPSNRVRGDPFRPVRAMGVDLFPQTMHCETILLFERVDYGSNDNAAKPQTTEK
ncbi:tRNA (uracil-5-)-methyltransferase homolog A isoform X2 [Trichomycterus rosablanca]|uniref:tRNA (uracil-5-)-methyltransferase homolog A isoform X2 n=1 Tax=Trichomycterus rosablanca TaxID=2290929 RepID=UPI002F354062